MAWEEDRHEWTKAYRVQARADFSAARLVVMHNGPPFVALMLLQMVFEKLRKAARAQRSGQAQQARDLASHRGAALLMGAIVEFGEKKWGVSAAFVGEVRSWRRVIEELEDLHPSHGKPLESPNLEYPWMDSHGHVHAPSVDLPNYSKEVQALLEGKRIRLLRLLRFSEELMTAVEYIV